MCRMRHKKPSSPTIPLKKSFSTVVISQSFISGVFGFINVTYLLSPNINSCLLPKNMCSVVFGEDVLLRIFMIAPFWSDVKVDSCFFFHLSGDRYSGDVEEEGEKIN